MIIARNLTIDVGPRRLLENADVTVQAGNKIGLVGRNGAGKTTLLRTLAGERTPDGGSVVCRGTAGYLSQEAELPTYQDPTITALERILTARAIGTLQRQIEEVRRKMENASGVERDRLIKRFARLDDEFAARGGYVAEAEAKQFGASLGIGNDELDQAVGTMSGGQRRRTELARILFGETDVLLLDEPTNHLDLDAKAWLMRFLAAYRGGLLVISHDLDLLDESITSVLALENQQVEVFTGNYSYYLSERKRRREQRVRERRNQMQKIERLEEGIRRFKGSTEKMAKRARSWETRVGRMRDELVTIEARGKSTKVMFPQPESSGRTPLRAFGLAKSFDENLVFIDVDIEIDRGERLLLLGLNGAGKTTLLRILAGEEAPDLGEVEIGYRVSIGYYAQEHEQIVEGRTVLEHMQTASSAPTQTLRTVLGHFLLADKVDQDAATLSGGEKTKLALAMLVMGKHNVLLLDEPTNNLDPQSKESLLEALRQYRGTLIIVSHDTDFVAELAPDRVIIMPEGRAHFFDESLLDLVALT